MIAAPLCELLSRLNGPRVPALERAVTQLCDAMENGHVCLPLGDDAELRACKVVGGAEDFTPLVLDGGRLYLRRYFEYERRLAVAILARAEDAAAHDAALLKRGLARFAEHADPGQLLAAERAVSCGLSVITGGPGTGKTRTAALALALLAEQGVRRFALAAPTGKAAARVAESLARALATLPLGDAAAAIPRVAATLHRLLGWQPGGAEFRHDCENPLPADVVIVDEASMVDLPLMAKLFDAIAPGARVVLLGDKDQLASVEAGHVLGDLCATLGDRVTTLTTNHRFAPGSAIAAVAERMNAGDVDEVLTMFAAWESDTVRSGRGATETSHAQNSRDGLCHSPADFTALRLPGRAEFSRELAARAGAGFAACVSAREPAEALRRLSDFRILCALRAGPHGVAECNRIAEAALAAAGHIAPERAHYAGRPLLILRNDYSLRLFNGDTGIVLPDEHGELRAFFPGEDGGVRAFAPSRLPEHETAFAMTVHKAQGSECARILLVLPERDAPVVTRELLYTGITRAKEHAELWWSEAPLRAALARRVDRWSGLAARLHSPITDTK